ncbi:MAG TPA: GMC family oxidoreductase N-terminal domain-containing protein, partial [Novosphingobium sp.]
MSKPFNPLQAAIIKALTEALFHDVEMKISADQVVANLQKQFGMIHGNKPTEIGLTLYLVCLFMGGPFFLLFPPEWRKQRIDKRLKRSKNNLLQDLARIRGVIYAGYYGHWEGKNEDREKGQDENKANPVLAQIGYTLPKHRVRNPSSGDVAIKPFNGRDLAHSDVLHPDALPHSAEIIVIGSGAGGAVAAANLSGHRHDVLVIEAGPHFPSPDITHEERRMTSRLFVDGGIQTSRDHDIVVFQGRVVGGSTVINNGICLRVKAPGQVHPAASDVFANWAALGAPVDEARFMKAYDAVESHLGIEEILPHTGRNNGPHLLNGWGAHAGATGDPQDAESPYRWFRKNYGPRAVGAECAYCGYCNTGCPYGRKHGMAQSYLLTARDNGARILADGEVRRIIWQDGKPGRAIGVEVVLPDGTSRVVRATKGVVVAAGALASSRILRNSGIKQAGSGISLNIACPVVALMPEDKPPMKVWDEDQMATYVDRGDFLLESHFQPPMSMSTLMPGWFGDHASRMRNYNRMASAGVLFPADRRGQLKGNGGLSFKLRQDVEIPLLRRALATLCKVHFAAGAIEVYPAVARGTALHRKDFDTHDKIDRFFERNVRE